MKIIMILLFCFSFSSCIFYGDGKYEYPTSNYKPIVIQKTALDSSIAFQDNIAITESSKIYIFNDYIFINDKRKGFHIFDNSDSSNPIKKKFLNIPGATDISIRNNVFFINQATDLVSLTINLNTFDLTINKRLKNVFPQLESPDGFYGNIKNEEIIVNWIKK